MKTSILFINIMLLAIFTYGQDINIDYDSTLAAQLGADDYGMKSYVLVILKTGNNDIQDKPTLDSLFAGHFENINRMTEEGKLSVAGPIANNDYSYRGIFILDVSTFEEALEQLAADPTIKQNIFDVELFKWYGSAALPTYLETHKKIQKHKIK